MISEPLSKILESKGWIPEELVTALYKQGVRVNLLTVSRWLDGRTSPRCEHLGPLADVLNCTADELLGRAPKAAA